MADQQDKKASKKGGAAAPAAAGPAPAYIDHRIKLWDELSARKKPVAGGKITITLPDGKTVEGVAGQTTALDVAKGISKGLAEKAVVAKVDAQLVDLTRPLEKDCRLQLHTFDSNEGKNVFWHSSAHILGRSLENLYGGNLCVGPALEDGGFYYDCELGDRKITPDDFKSIDAAVDNVIKEKYSFQRLVLSKAEALEMFKHNPFKVELINSKVPDGAECTAYRCGPLIDLCRGPHLPDTGRVKAMVVTKASSSYWLGKETNPTLQRVYGMSFPDKKLLKEWQAFMEMAAARDHRKLGPEQGLFVFNDVSPGSAFFLPHGARIYNKLIEFMRGEYRKRGFDEVITPNVFNVSLWKTSGHYDNYKENMFIMDVEGQEFGMKPMNCPGHCVLFKSQLHSYRELPLRYADFGVLHRNELSGALSGLTRVRRFQQDDAHIFCRLDQIEQEINGALDFLKFVYARFGFEFSLALSTRPEKYLGSIEQWDEAEAALARCLDRFGQEWRLNPADGAFYGPKIDIHLTDALRRKFQCATIQLDFQLPRRFDLKYKAEDGSYQRPVMVHRAILGSVERMFAVLLEHTGGKFPFWLSPRQAIVVPISATYNEYATRVKDRLWGAGFYVDVDVSSDQFKKKIRDAQVNLYNFILVVGEQEAQNGTVNVRSGRENKVHGMRSVEDVLREFALPDPSFGDGVVAGPAAGGDE